MAQLGEGKPGESSSDWCDNKLGPAIPGVKLQHVTARVPLG